ncbi:MAG: hypothetical protein COU63_04685 [Candidatus Pacebacteria bacterium CG10_big_fil_rev_8_21_14_0_10_36_11]|nr:hypothetical protein [Candidatus Pacearchaeota archaeon]OIP73995.1 MAG: hypothetical protein AUK08_01930 [Candidatus Pacebacteria bacterium CG2_30_36_39]PIR64366.1 MAG: hypothetical protein COU63_04685 [Candidatus Pacebacteria bacterium CG10_big_fil_rev_8_21_14_0_10_36_11]
MTEQSTNQVNASPLQSTSSAPVELEPQAKTSFLAKIIGKWKIIVGGILGIALLAVTSYFVYANFFISPKHLLGEAMEKFDVDSIKIGFQASDDTSDVSGTMIAHEKGLSKIDANLSMLEEGVRHEFNFNFLIDEENVYFKMNYSLMELILMQADQVVPGISSTNTFTLLKPVLTGKSWLHAAVPPVADTTSDDKAEEYAEEWEKFGDELGEAIIIKDYKRNQKVDGVTYKVISLGVDKVKLLTAIDSLKDLDLEVSVSDINTLKKSVEDMGELKETLAVVYIDKKGYIRMADLYAPQGSSESIQDAIDQEAAASSPLLAQFSQMTSFFQPDKKAKAGESVKFMTMTFDDYGTAEELSAPSNSVEWDEVMLYAQSELMPIFYQYMMMQQAPGAGGVELPTYPPQYPGNSSGGVPSYPIIESPDYGSTMPGQAAPY